MKNKILNIKIPSSIWKRILARKEKEPYKSYTAIIIEIIDKATQDD